MLQCSAASMLLSVTPVADKSTDQVSKYKFLFYTNPLYCHKSVSGYSGLNGVIDPTYYSKKNYSTIPIAKSCVIDIDQVLNGGTKVTIDMELGYSQLLDEIEFKTF